MVGNVLVAYLIKQCFVWLVKYSARAQSKSPKETNQQTYRRELSTQNLLFYYGSWSVKVKNVP